MRKKKCEGYYPDKRPNGTMDMPTAASQEIFDKYCPPISDWEMDHIEENLDRLSESVKYSDEKFADEMLAFLRRQECFEEGYEMLDDGEKAHLWLILLAQQDMRSIETYL